MTEILLIFFIVCIYTFAIFLPFYEICFCKFKNINFKSSLDKYVFNCLFLLNIILVLFLINIKIQYVVYFIYFFSFLSLIFYIKRFLSLKKKEKKNLVFLPLIFVTFIISIDLAYNLTLGWYVQSVWVLKTIHFFNGESIQDLKNITRSEYPFLGSLIWAFFWKFSNLDFEYFGRIFYISIFCLSVLNIIDLLKISLKYKSLIFLSLIMLIYD